MAAGSAINAEDMKGTMRLLTRVLQKCEDEKASTGAGQKIPLENYIDRAVRYTGLHKDVLLQISGLLESDTESIVSMKLEEIDRDVIQEEWVSILLSGYLPTTKQLYSILQNKIPAYVDIRTFRTQLIKFGYIWKKIEGYTWVVIEKPTVTFERYLYLKQLIEFMNQNRSVVYVDVFNIQTNADTSTVEKSQGEVNLNSNDKSYMYAISKYDVHALKECKVGPDVEYTEAYLDWIENDLSTHIPVNSVVIFSPSEFNKEEIVKLPTKDSLKSEMMDWLEYHNVPCNRSMSKLELYTLVEQFTNSVDKLYKFDEILKIKGHKALHLPESIKDLTPINMLREFIQKNLNTHKQFVENLGLSVIVENINRTHLDDAFEFIEKEIAAVFDRDEKVDQVFDIVCENMKDYQVEKDDADSDLPDISSDSE